MLLLRNKIYSEIEIKNEWIFYIQYIDFRLSTNNIKKHFHENYKLYENYKFQILTNEIFLNYIL